MKGNSKPGVEVYAPPSSYPPQANIVYQNPQVYPSQPSGHSQNPPQGYPPQSYPLPNDPSQGYPPQSYPPQQLYQGSPPIIMKSQGCPVLFQQINPNICRCGGNVTVKRYIGPVTWIVFIFLVCTCPILSPLPFCVESCQDQRITCDKCGFRQ